MMHRIVLIIETIWRMNMLSIFWISDIMIRMMMVVLLRIANPDLVFMVFQQIWDIIGGKTG